MQTIILGNPRPWALETFGKSAQILELMRCNAIVYYRRPTSELPTLRRKIKNTEYIVSGRLSNAAKETAAAKMRRIILNAEVEN